tara:strand:- start:188 stop:394 length:207 start_codon:yes stop_codon:yes gene_type:complete
MSQKNTHNKDITRKQALKKMGTYAAFAALGTMIMLNPQKAQAVSGPPNPSFGGPNSNVRGVRIDRNKK